MHFFEYQNGELYAEGVPVALVEFAGEQHGFRLADNIRRALEGELYFFSRAFGFQPADTLEPLAIDNEGELRSPS